MYTPESRTEFAAILAALDVYAGTEGLYSIRESLLDAQVALAMAAKPQLAPAGRAEASSPDGSPLANN